LLSVASKAFCGRCHTSVLVKITKTSCIKS